MWKWSENELDRVLMLNEGPFVIKINTLSLYEEAASDNDITIVIVITYL